VDKTGVLFRPADCVRLSTSGCLPREVSCQLLSPVDPWHKQCDDAYSVCKDGRVEAIK
jgi:hypothetical protein